MRKLLFWTGSCGSAISLLYLIVRAGLDGFVAGVCMIVSTILSMTCAVSILKSKKKEEEIDEQFEEDVR